MLHLEAKTILKLAVVGTSHVSALRLAQESVTQYFDGIYFFALNAPILSKQNYLGWPGEPGTMSCNIPEGTAFLKRLFGDARHAFDPLDFSHILLVDFFFCMDFSFIFRDRSSNALRISDTLISDTLFEEVVLSKLGISSYGEHSAVGTVPENSIIPLLENMRNRAPDSKFFLSPRPFQPSRNKGHLNIQLSKEEVDKGRNCINNSAIKSLNRIGITYLAPTDQQLCPDTGLTKDEFSVGPSQNNQSMLDEHMNSAFGELVLNQMLQSSNTEGDTT